MKLSSESTRYSLLFALLGATFFMAFLGGVHLFDWDEINFAEITREMVSTGDYTRVYINYRLFWEKPPMFPWLQLPGFLLFGVGEFAARFPNAVCGIATLVLLFNLGRKLYDTRFGVIWAGVYFGSILPFLYFKSGIIDPWFNLFIFAGLYLFILFYWKKDRFEGIDLPRSAWTYLVAGGLILGLGILTKGPVAYLIAILTLGTYWVSQRFRWYAGVHHFLVYSLAASVGTLAWYGWETLKNGPWLVVEFSKYQYRLFSTPDAGHGGSPAYHFIVLLLGCFPASVFAIRAFGRLPQDTFAYQADFRRWMKYLFWVVLILFTIVKSKIVHYSSMCYFPLTFLSAIVIYRIVQGQVPLRRWMKVMLAVIGGIFVMLTLAVPFLGMNIALLKPLLNDPFAQANLEAAVRWTGWETIPGLLLSGLLIATFVRWRRRDWFGGFRVLFGGTAVFTLLTLVFFIGRIEGYSQNAAIEFYESKAAEDCYILPYGYHSYAHLYYARKRPVTDDRSYDSDWLLRGDVNKPVYIVAKITSAGELRALPTLEELYGKNGFVFFRRK